jgi:predicted DCC family thiol-disulfide oxidoreductase YuxK
MPLEGLDDKNIILFDGVCTLCNGSVKFLLKHDKEEYFHFASIQSELGALLIEKYGLEEVDSIIYISENKAYIYSEAIVQIVKNLKSWHRYIYFSHFVPRRFRDAIYRLVAKSRYHVFGKEDNCMIPTESIVKRFL